MPSTTLLEIPPEEQAQMRAVRRRARYGYLLALHILLLCAAGRNPTEMCTPAIPTCRRKRSAFWPTGRRSRIGTRF
jgi:hypothetical protein